MRRWEPGVAGGENVDSGEENLSFSCGLLGLRGNSSPWPPKSAATAIVVLSAGSSSSKIGTRVSEIPGTLGIPSFSKILPVVEMRQFKMELATLTVPSSILPRVPVVGSVIIHEAKR